MVFTYNLETFLKQTPQSPYLDPDESNHIFIGGPGQLSIRLLAALIKNICTFLINSAKFGSTK